MIWGFLKQHLRRTCQFDYKALQRDLPAALMEIPTAFFRKASDHCFQYMDWYRNGWKGAALEFAKKFKSHRGISAETVAIVRQEYDEFMRKRNGKL
jgi:hypothetical protein